MTGLSPNRCPNRTRRNKKTKKCEKTRRCKKGTRRNQKTLRCIKK